MEYDRIRNNVLLHIATFQQPSWFFEIHESTQMEKAVKFVPMYNMKLYITCHHGAGKNLGTHEQDIFKITREKWLM